MTSIGTIKRTGTCDVETIPREVKLAQFATDNFETARNLVRVLGAVEFYCPLRHIGDEESAVVLLPGWILRGMREELKKNKGLLP